MVEELGGNEEEGIVGGNKMVWVIFRVIDVGVVLEMNLGKDGKSKV